MPETLRWMLAALAAIRLTWTLVYDDGPAALLFRLRDACGAYDYGEEPGPDGQPEPRGELGRFWQCPYCVGLAAAGIAAALALWPGIVGDALLAWWGLAGAVLVAVRWRPWRK